MNYLLHPPSRVDHSCNITHLSKCCLLSFQQVHVAMYTYILHKSSETHIIQKVSGGMFPHCFTVTTFAMAPLNLAFATPLLLTNILNEILTYRIRRAGLGPNCVQIREACRNCATVEPPTTDFPYYRMQTRGCGPESFPIVYCT